MKYVITKYVRKDEWFIEVIHICPNCKYDNISRDNTHCPNCNTKLKWKKSI